MPKAAILLIVLTCSVSIAHPDIAHADDRVYSVGVVPQFESRRISEIWRPILRAVSEISGYRLELKASPDIPEFEQQFSAGEFDFAYMNPYHLIVANKVQGYTPLVRDVAHNLFGIIVVKQNSPYHKVEQLDGKTVAFPAPNALGASLIPRAEFKNKFHISVNEIYVKSHSSVYLNVVMGLVDAGGGVLKTLTHQPEEIRNQLRLLYKTSRVSPHPFTAHPDVEKEVQTSVAEAFLALGSTENGKILLGKIPVKEMGKAKMKDYEELRDMGLSEFYVEK